MQNQSIFFNNKSNANHEAAAAYFAHYSILIGSLFIISYCGVYIWLKAYLAAIINIITFAIFIPIMFFYISKRNIRLAGILVIYCSLFVVSGTSLALNNLANNDYYFLPCMMLSLLLFDPKDTFLITISFISPLITWVLMKLMPNPFTWTGLLPTESFPYEAFQAFNFVGASVMSALFILIYARSLKQAKEVETQANALLLTTSKMASLGELASGIAHEINNPLSIIVARTHILKEKIELIDSQDFNLKSFDTAVCKQNLSKIEETAALITRIVRGLKDFSRTGDQDPASNHSLLKIINFAFELTQDRIETNDIKFDIVAPNDIIINCREVQIAQVLINLISNSIDAVEKIPIKWIKIELTFDKHFAYVHVSDSGNGVPQVNFEKVMQPFFSTKQPGKGIGLGLSISMGIIESHGGKLYIDNTSEFTKFSFSLPR